MLILMLISLATGISQMMILISLATGICQACKAPFPCQRACLAEQTLGWF